MKLFNSLTKQKEDFKPIHSDKIGIYTCGPTVYSFVTIGNWRTYTLGDLVFRTIKYLYPEYQVDYVMNITDVGHLTGDNLGDADTGEDRLEKAASLEGKTAFDIANFYATDFANHFKTLNLLWPTLPMSQENHDLTSHFSKATEHIKEQIDMVLEIEKNGFAYKITDGIYFDTKAFEEAGFTYGQLSNIDQLKEGARVEPNPEKRDPRDFALWKFSYPLGRPFDANLDDESEKRHMEWESPWGLGFPGWHIECSAMSTKYLGEQFDIHLGGEDLKSTHHPNEIAQAEAVTGKQFVKFWLHGAFLQVDGGRMGKSLGNAYTLTDIKDQGYDPLALRYFYFSAHYRKPLNFTWEGLEASAKAYNGLKLKLRKLNSDNQNSNHENFEEEASLQNDFKIALEDDLNMPQALAVIWKLVDDTTISNNQKIKLIEEFDQILGLDLLNFDNSQKFEVPENILDLVSQREKFRSQKDFAKADEIRDQIRELGFEILDTENGVEVVKS